MKILNLILLALLITGPLFSQSMGFYDDFEDGSVDTLWNGSSYTLWKADHTGTFGISESEGYLNIAYSRTAESGIWDNFNFTPPREIDVAENPHITLKIKSDVATTFTVKPIYTNGNDGWLQKDIPADNAWHFYTCQLVEANYSGGNLQKIYLYFDGGSSESKSGLVLFDDFQIAGYSISITNLQAYPVDSASVDLSWKSSDPDSTDYFKLYRSTEMEYEASEDSKIGETSDTVFHDTGLNKHTSYYYKVSATDKDGKEHAPAKVSITTTNPGSIPRIVPESVNSDPVGTYEKFEVVLDLLDADYENPYNPEEIDLYAWFYSPDGDSVKMNGFYDNYDGRNQWKIRFAANQTGSWQYQVFASDLDGTGESEKSTFSVIESGNKGWLHISPDNSNYFMHDDGSSFYGIAVYYPWNVTQSGLDKFASVSGNFIGYWDCTFDNGGNGGGKYLLESMESGVGRYDQRKAARIDEVLAWAEARDMKVMLSMWVHGYLRVDGVPWADGRWFSDNPYSQLVDIDDFYTDSLALTYQEKHYRYMIARWGYSQSLGVWEIINEMHGTTGWVRSQASSKKWVENVHRYFTDNDPFRRPTTASFGGGEGASHFSETDQLGDIPNVHFYELHGWPNPYPENVVRSGLANVVNETRKLKGKGDRPAFFGEAGYTHMLADHQSEAYTWELHNSFWAGLCNGMASTPFWWEFNTTDILTAVRLQDYHRFSAFVSDIDFAHQTYAPAGIWVENTDGFFMGSPSSGFGWMYNYEKTSLSKAPIYISDTELSNGNYTLEWFHTWTGETVKTDSTICVSGISWGEVPEEVNALDVAFKLGRIENGSPATRVHLYLVKKDTVIPAELPWQADIDSTLYKIACYLTDDEMRLDVAYNGPVEISMDGEGQATEPFTLTLSDGGVVFDYERLGSSGVTITATIEGLDSNELFIEGVTGIVENDHRAVRGELSLRNFPNPFTQSTVIAFELAHSTHVKLAVYNAQGGLLEVLWDDQKPAGHHRVIWNAEDQPAGIYFYTLSSEQFSITNKCFINK
ncbi:MAG: DUF5060 domain-containing protein [Bacteroidota bacterium]